MSSRAFGSCYVDWRVPTPHPLWTDAAIDKLRSILVDSATDLTSGFVGHGPLNRGRRTLPSGLNHNDFEFAAFLMDRYVVDAFGIQVLTSDHVERMRRPDRWTIRELGRNRHLVESPHLDRWYSDEHPDRPDPETQAQARDDFAGLILTADIINASPSPGWPVPHINARPSHLPPDHPLMQPMTRP